MVLQQQQELAYKMTMEYFKQNHLFNGVGTYIDETVENFAKTENLFFEAIRKHTKLFDKRL